MNAISHKHVGQNHRPQTVIEILAKFNEVKEFIKLLGEVVPRTNKLPYNS